MDETEQSHYFSFDNDNVVFASALHGLWLFSIFFLSLFSLIFIIQLFLVEKVAFFILNHSFIIQVMVSL